LDSHDSALSQLQTLIDENTQLKQELALAQNAIQQVQQTNQQLQEQLSRLQNENSTSTNILETRDVDMTTTDEGTMASRYANPNFEPAPREELILRPSFAAMAAKLSQAPSAFKKKTITEKQRSAALRLFTTPPKDQGFQYVYLHTRGKVAPSVARQSLKKAGIPQGRLLELHYPDQNVIALLFHNNYVAEVKHLLRKANILHDFNPLSPTIIRDPKFQELSEADKTSKVLELQQQRLIRALHRIRTPVNSAVAKSFLNNEGITLTQYEAFKHGLTTQHHDDDEDMNDDDPLTQFTPEQPTTNMDTINNSQAEGGKSAQVY
jgi:uncharacterized phage infection (PIP) family protein YhgE